MKLAFLAAANSIHAIRWVKYFSERGHEIYWISLAPPIAEAEELIGKVNFYEIKPSPLTDINGVFGWLYLLPAAWKTRKILKSASPEVLHVHSAGTYGLVGALSGFHPTVLTPWGSDILLTSPIKKPLIKYVVKSADFFTCDGENTFQKLVEFGAPSKKIQFIRFGVETEKFPAPGRKIKTSPVTVISLRTLIPTYDIETLIRAAAIVVKKTSDVRFVVAGDGEQRVYLENLSKELGLEKLMKFTGRYQAGDLPKMLGDSDIYVSTSLSDSGLSASTAEAMAAGLPVVVTDSGDNREWVIENKGGFVVPLRDPEELARKVTYLIENEKMRRTFGEYNRLVIGEKNNYRKEMAKMEKIYEKISALN